MKTIFLKGIALTTLTLAGLFLLQAPSEAAETVYNLSAGVTTKTMPDGEVVTMWGFANEDNTAPLVASPGPVLVVPPGNSLRINLTNNLPAPHAVSIVILGQAMPLDGVGTSPQITRNPDGRIRSFTHETPNGETRSYVWPGIKSGTYLYQSGTHQAVQVQMGLYGALKNDAGAGEAYTGQTYANELTLLYSEIDPALHAAVRDNTYGTTAYPSTIDYMPKYFLINGMPWTPTSGPSWTVPANQTLLIRFLNSGLQTRVPVLLGMDMDLIAEDGNLYPYPTTRYSVPLFAGKTTDALLVPGAPGTFALFDRALGVVNGLTGPGGMIGHISITP